MPITSKQKQMYKYFTSLWNLIVGYATRGTVRLISITSNEIREDGQLPPLVPRVLANQATSVADSLVSRSRPGSGEGYMSEPNDRG